MAKATESRDYAGKSADDCFAAAKAALPKVGFEIWKMRPIGWLLLANRTTSEGVVNANFAFRPGAAATLTLSSDRVTKEALLAMSGEVYAAFEAALG